MTFPVQQTPIETEFGEEAVLIEQDGETQVFTSPTNEQSTKADVEETAVEKLDPHPEDETPEPAVEEAADVEAPVETSPVAQTDEVGEPAPEETVEAVATLTEPSVVEDKEALTAPAVEVPTLDLIVDERIEKTQEEAPAVTEEEPAETTTTVADVEDFNERDFDKNPTVLFALLQKKEWKAAQERAHLHPEEAQVWVSRKEKDGRLRWRLLPIHAAIVFKAPDEVMDTLLQTFPEGAHSKDDQGMLPLHLAFRNHSSEGVVQLLLAAYPQSIDVKDRKGRIPLILAQASSAPHKDALLRALVGGPTNHAVASVSTERATVTAEQRAIFDAKVTQLQQSHGHELAAAQMAAESQQRELFVKIDSLEQELTRTHETSQVLVDHVNSLEAQLNSRSDTERFLATKIATLDSSLKSTTKGKEEVESKLVLENVALIAERDGYKAKYDELEVEHDLVQSKLTESVNFMEKREQEFSRAEAQLTEQLKITQFDWANAQANCAISDAQLKRKLENEHALATQVSVLAGKLAESACDTRDSTIKFSKRTKELEEERLILRESVKDLTKRLQLVARVLDDMASEQHKIVKESQTHETAIAEALAAHANIVGGAMAQQHLIEDARREREEMKKVLAMQEEKAANNEENRKTIMSAIVIQGKHMEKTKNARDDMLESVKTMGSEFKVVLNSILSVLPTTDVEKEELVDAVIRNVVGPSPAEEKREDGPIDLVSHSEPTVDQVPSTLSHKSMMTDEENTASTARTSKDDGADEEDIAEDQTKATNTMDLNDRIMAARTETTV